MGTVLLLFLLKGQIKGQLLVYKKKKKKSWVFFVFFVSPKRSVERL